MSKSKRLEREKRQILDWVVKNKTPKEVLEDVAEGTLIYARLLMEYGVTIGELMDAFDEMNIKVGGTDD